jgi:hypothetical protein
MANSVNFNYFSIRKVDNWKLLRSFYLMLLYGIWAG